MHRKFTLKSAYFFIHHWLSAAERLILITHQAATALQCVHRVFIGYSIVDLKIQAL